MTREGKKLGLTAWILMAMIGGILCGLVLYYLLPAELRWSALNELTKAGADAGQLAAVEAEAHDHWINYYLIDGLFAMLAKMFIKTLKMLVVPLVFVSLICGTSALGDPKKLGRIGGKTVVLYMITTGMAISVALIVAAMVGVGADAELAGGDFSAKASPPLSQVIVDIVPANPIQAMAEGKMLQVIFFAILVGLAISLVGAAAEPVKKFFNDLNEIVMKMITILMTFAPVGVFAVVAKVFGEKGLDPVKDLVLYFFVMLFLLLFHATVNYSLLLKFLARLSPFRFFENIRPAAMFAFSTASSNATLPITLETVEKRLGVDNKVASFTIPLGATINMDGTAIMQGVATVFIANATGNDLSFVQYLTVILTATLASVGTAGVPGVGMITLAMVLKQVGLPEEGILLLLPVDRILDMCRTAVNVCGDAAVTCVVAKSEGQLDEKTFDEPIPADYGDYHFESK